MSPFGLARSEAGAFWIPLREISAYHMLVKSHTIVGQPPIEQQPLEILMKIFVYVRILEHETPSHDPILSSFAVNRRWRSLALSMPILWSTITVIMTTPYWNSRVLLTELYEKRAESTPQTWIIRDTGRVDEDTTSACTTLLSKHLPHIQNLVIDSPWLTRSIMIHTSSTQLASLKRLTINTTPGPLVTELLKAENLEHVYLASIFHSGTRLFPCLKTLYANVYAISFYEVILQSPKLEGLTINVLAPRAEEGPDPSIPLLIDRLPLSLPFLTTLSLCWSGCDVSIDKIPNLPALRQVDLSHYPNWSVEGRELEMIGTFLRKLPPALHNLCYSSSFFPSKMHYERTCKMFFESTQSLTNVRKLVFSGGLSDVRGPFLIFLQMFFAAPSFASVTKLAIHDFSCCALEDLETLFSSDIVRSWFSFRKTGLDEILDVDIYPREVDIESLAMSPLPSKWDGSSNGDVPLRLRFLDILVLPRRMMKTFPYIYELDPHVDAHIPFY